MPVPQAIRDEIVKQLENCVAIRDEKTRTLVVERLPKEIRVKVPYHPALRVHVTILVETCAAHPHGLLALVKAVRWFEGDTYALLAILALLPRE